MKKLLITLLVVCLLPISRVQALDNDVTPNAKSAILIEANSRQILYDKNAEEKLYPASTTKIMTMILMFEALRINNHLMMNYYFKYAASMGGSQVYLEVGEVYL